MEIGKEYSIQVTHWTNPSRFFFREYDDGSMKSKINEIEKNIKNHVEENNFYFGCYNNYRPVKFDIVAYYDEPLKKWIRCAVEDVFEFQDHVAVYLWSIDYGFPFQTKIPNHNLRKLPNSFGSNDIFIQQGSVDVIPAEIFHDFLNDSKKLRSCKTWGGYCMRTFGDVLEEFKGSIRFEPKYVKYFGLFKNFVIGDLLLGSEKLSLAERFVEEKLGIQYKHENEFYRQFKDLSVHKLERYDDNDRSGGVFIREFGISDANSLKIASMKDKEFLNTSNGRKCQSWVEFNDTYGHFQ